MNIVRFICVMLFAFATYGQCKSSFEVTPEMYASIMAKSLEGGLPHTFQREGLSLVVTKVYSEKNRVYFNATTTQYKGIVAELKKHRTLPEELKSQCKEFSQLAFVDKGVEYILQVEAKNEKPLVVLYDKEACLPSFDPHQKIFIDGYNRYGLSMSGQSKKGIKL